MSIPEHLQPRYRDLLQVVNTMNAGLLATDNDGNVLWANTTLLRWLGYSFDEVVGNHAVTLGVAEHQEAHRTEIAAIRGGDLRPRLVVLRRSDGTTFPGIVIPQHFHDEEGHDTGVFSVLVDMGTVQTAKRVGVESSEASLMGALDEIASQLRSMSTPPTAPENPIPMPRDHAALADVSPREAEVLELLVTGDRVSSIAAQLFISEHTVRNHLKSMFRKTGTSSQAELIQFVREL